MARVNVPANWLATGNGSDRPAAAQVRNPTTTASPATVPTTAGRRPRSRPLRKAADYARFAGQEAKLTLREPVDGARKVKGILRGLEGDAARVETEAGVRAIALGNIEKARLVPKIEWR